MLAVSLTVAISSMACGGKTEEQRGEDAVEAFTDEVGDALEQIELAHGSLFDPEISALPASQQEARTAPTQKTCGGSESDLELWKSPMT